MRLAIAAVLTIAACTPRRPGPPRVRTSDLAAQLADAIDHEIVDAADPARYLAVIDSAVHAPDAPGAVEATFAAVDALVLRSLPELDVDTAIIDRSEPAFDRVRAGLERAWADTTAGTSRPLLRGRIASALYFMALVRGDVAAAERWSSRTGCARAATVIGPLEPMPLVALDHPAIDPHAPLAASYAEHSVFGLTHPPVRVTADSCALDVHGASSAPGSRAVVVDLHSKRAQRIHVEMFSDQIGIVRVGGAVVVRRGTEAGERLVHRYGSVEIPAGVTRLVLDTVSPDDSVRLRVLDEDGEPVETTAPAVGDIAAGVGSNPRELPLATLPGETGALTTAAADLAIGDARAALEALETMPHTPAIDLLYLRAAGDAQLLAPSEQRIQLTAAVDRILAARKTAWEAQLADSALAMTKHKDETAALEALRVLGATDPHAAWHTEPMLAAYVAVQADRAEMLEVREAAYRVLVERAPRSRLTRAIDRKLHPRYGAEALHDACEDPLDRATGDCYQRLRDRGELDRARAELERLRRLRGSHDILRNVEVDLDLRAGDARAALAAYDALPPGERAMRDVLAFVASKGDVETARKRLARDQANARDPFSIVALMHVLGTAPGADLTMEADNRALIAADRAKPFAPGSDVAVLRHIERYWIEPSGLLHHVIVDVRRFANVENGSRSYLPQIDGDGTQGLIRRRIHKRDGRVIDTHDDAQLEQGDYIEQVNIGWYRPHAGWKFSVNTSDLLPEDGSVHELHVEVTRPASLPLAVWAHPRLGTPVERSVGDSKITTYEVHDVGPHRPDYNLTWSDRSTTASFTTNTWADFANALQERLRLLDDRDPWVDHWFDELAGGDRARSRAMLGRVVSAIGERVRSTGADVLVPLNTDAEKLVTARAIIQNGEGCRSWLTYRALRHLGFDVEVALIESSALTAFPGYPPHDLRFTRPLLLVHLGGADGDVWIDAEVKGAPLPPGQVNPDLHGRSILVADGTIRALDGTEPGRPADIDVDLAIDVRGDARGTVRVALHGLDARRTGEALERAATDGRRDVLRGVIENWLPGALIDDVAMPTATTWDLTVEAKIQVPALAQPEGRASKRWLVSGMLPLLDGDSLTFGRRYVTSGATRLTIDSAMAYHLHRRITLPAGASVARGPDAVSVELPYLRATRASEVKAGVVDEEFRIELWPTTVVPDAYPAFVEAARTIDDGFLSTIRVESR